jgi:hypothetical protein
VRERDLADCRKSSLPIRAAARIVSFTDGFPTLAALVALEGP